MSRSIDRDFVKLVWSVRYPPTESILLATEEDALKFIADEENINHTEIKIEDGRAYGSNGLISGCIIEIKNVWKMK